MVLLCFCIGSCGTGDCRNTILKEWSYPNGSMTVSTFERNCGATTAKNMQLLLRLSVDKFDPNKQPSFLVFEAGSMASVIWVSETELKVVLPKTVRIYRQDPLVGSIKILYESVSDEKLGDP